jgi:hypothetical protein
MNEKRQISASHRQLLLSMGLVVVAGDDLILTETGRQRLDLEERGQAYREEPRSQASS